MTPMLFGLVTNDRQRQRFEHSKGPLNFGRLPHDDVPSVLIDDVAVSRDQLRLEELNRSSVRLDNRGRSTVFSRDGSRILPGESGELNLPISITVGRTVIEIASESLDPGLSGIRPTLHVDSLSDTGFVNVVEIARDFPYPLCTGYRQLNDLASNAERYRELLRLAENTLAFVGSLTLALLDAAHLRQMGDSLGQPALSFWQGGISPGHWLTLTIHASRKLRAQDDNSLARHLGGLQLQREDKGLGKAVRALIKAKNDYKHDRGPSIESEYKCACASVTDLIVDAFDLLAFFQEHRLLRVRDVNPHRRDPMADVVFLRCVGGTPGFLTEQWVYSPTVTKGDLYIETEPQELAPLYPFVHAETCAQCKVSEFYFVDRLDSQRRTDRPERGYVAGLKSFDRGHVAEDADIGSEMQQQLGT